MDRKQIIEVISTRFKNLNKILPRVEEHFDNESIHHFRHETKKLRAFLRLCSFELNQPNELRVPKKLKQFYGYIGIIENLQLQQQKIAPLLLRNSNCADKKSYLQLLQTEEHYWRLQAKSIVPEDCNFKDEEQDVIDLLPYKISKETIRKFIHHKNIELQDLLSSFQKDESLHRIRKIINDYIYNWQFIESCSSLLPARLSTLESLKLFSELLSHFRNVYIALNLLNSTLRDNEKNNPETPYLQQIEAEWQKEKEEVKERIYLKLLQLQVIHSIC